MANKASTNINYGEGVWEAAAYEKINVETVLSHLGAVQIFFRKQQRDDTTPPVSRDVKDLLIKGD